MRMQHLQPNKVFKVSPQQTMVKTNLIIVTFYSELVPIFKFLCSCPLKKKPTFMLKKQTLCKQERKISSFPKSFLLSWWVRGKIACEQSRLSIHLLCSLTHLSRLLLQQRMRACLQARGQQVGKTEESYYLMCELGIKWFANTALLISNKSYQFATKTGNYVLQSSVCSSFKNNPVYTNLFEECGEAQHCQFPEKWLKDMLSFL